MVINRSSSTYILSLPRYNTIGTWSKYTRPVSVTQPTRDSTIRQTAPPNPSRNNPRLSIIGKRCWCPMKNAVHVKSWLTYIDRAREIVDDAWRQRAPRLGAVSHRYRYTWQLPASRTTASIGPARLSSAYSLYLFGIVIVTYCPQPRPRLYRNPNDHRPITERAIPILTYSCPSDS